jgi:hypothetical protein
MGEIVFRPRPTHIPYSNYSLVFSNALNQDKIIYQVGVGRNAKIPAVNKIFL